MSSNYSAIRTDNERRYGTDIGRIGQMLLADRYDDRTHFIFELLQNAEDALSRRAERSGLKAVRFNLMPDKLRFSHYGKLFDESDVRGICGIAETTKDKDRNAIGRFGIGFKSVYAYTNRPEIYSGDEAFAIESFVWPTPINSFTGCPGESIISLPLNAGVDAAHEEITKGLKQLGPTALLFLREIEEIEWTVENGPSGIYMRNKPDYLADGLRRISVLGQQVGEEEIDQSWLIFSRNVTTPDGIEAGQIEVAFSTAYDKTRGNWSIQPVSNSPLVVYFPTVVPTHLGFLLQGPYKTTPSRDNIIKNDPWNKQLVGETCRLLIESLQKIRDMGILNTETFSVLPINRSRFTEGQMFAPVFEAVREALRSEKLLPSADNSYIAASEARLARIQELRSLFTPRQLGDIFGEKEEIYWLSGDITQDRTPEVRQYLMQELGVAEVTPESILSRLTTTFLEAQSDEWVESLYVFLGERPALHRRVEDLSLVRLFDGRHVKLKHADGTPQAFLPGVVKTGFPTVRPSVCSKDVSRNFLMAIGVREPDPVDDVIINVLPKYHSSALDISNDEYADDVGRFLAAYQTDSTGQRSKLTNALAKACWVQAVNTCDGSKELAWPGNVYLATDRLKNLFEGVEGVQLVDVSYECLKGENIRELLEASGAVRYLRTVPTQLTMKCDELREMRRKAGLERDPANKPPSDYTLSGINGLLKTISTVGIAIREQKARLLWEALVELETRRGPSAFFGTYSWSYFHESKAITFDAAFVRLINKSAWIPTADGLLHPPREVVFDSLTWKPDPFLLSKILFKPPIIDQLAKEAGIDPGVLDLLKRLGVTSEEDLRRRLRVDPVAEGGSEAEDKTETNDALAEGAIPVDREPKGEEGSADATGNQIGGGDGSGEDADGDGEGQDVGGGGKGKTGGAWHKWESQGGTRTGHGSGAGPGKAGGSRPFVSYIGADPVENDEDAHDPDGLDRKGRMALEAKAIDLIISQEPDLQRTKANNAGFDLYEAGENGRPNRWVEVKAMTASLDGRPVCMSRTQFDCAWVNGEAFWLYVVEHAGDESKARIIKINDPAGKAKNFTFDRGWRLAAGEDALHSPSDVS